MSTQSPTSPSEEVVDTTSSTTHTSPDTASAAPVDTDTSPATTTSTPAESVQTETSLAAPVEAQSDAQPHQDIAAPQADADAASNTTAQRPSALARLLRGITLLASLVALGLAIFLWRNTHLMQQHMRQQLGYMQQQITTEATSASLALTQAQTAQQRLGTLEGQIGQLTTQHSQLSRSLQTLARLNDEALLAELDTAIQLGMQQAHISGSVQPLLATLMGAERRLASAPPQLLTLRQAIQRDMDKLKQANVNDVPLLLGKMDAVLQHIDSLPLQSQLPHTPAANPNEHSGFWQRNWHSLRQSLSSLVRLRAAPSDSALVLPAERSYYLRENIKLHLLSARMALLAHQPQLSRSDIDDVRQQIQRHFDGTAPNVQAAVAALEDIRQYIHLADLPAITDTLAALHNARTTLTTTVPAPASSEAGTTSP